MENFYFRFYIALAYVVFTLNLVDLNGIIDNKSILDYLGNC
jgi:hypothetical protein